MKITKRSLKLTLVILAGGVLAVGLLGLVGVSPTLAKTVIYSYNEKYPIYYYDYNPCAGEYIKLSGDVHYLYHFTMDGSGGYHGKSHSNYQDVTGVGWSTGNKYRVISTGNYEWNGKVGYESTDTYKFRIIGPGPNNDWVVSYKYHITVNPDGTATSYHSDYKYECK